MIDMNLSYTHSSGFRDDMIDMNLSCSHIVVATEMT